MGNTCRTICRAGGALALLLLGATAAQAQRESYIVANSAQTVQELVRDPYRGVPREVLQQAQGVIIFPNMLQAGFVFGARHGRGVVLERDASGQWSNPFFIRMTGGTFGLQVGADTNEMMLVFRDRGTIDRFLLGRNKLTFGADASFALGPTGQGVGANTDPSLRADIYVYSRSRGLFAGAAIGGAVARVDHRANWDFYGMEASPSDIVEGIDGLTVPPSVDQLKQALTLPGSGGDSTKQTASKPKSRRSRKTQAAAEDAPQSGFEPDSSTLTESRNREVR